MAWFGGAVLCHPNSTRGLSPEFFNRFDTPATAGLFTKVSAKPTNHSKFTGKCGRSKCSDYHIHPACKSKDKTKGTKKLRSSCDVSANYKLVSWRVVDAATPTSLKELSGSSATGLLDHLGSDNTPYCLDQYYDVYEGDNDVYEFHESFSESAAVEMKDDDNELIIFCDAGIVWEEVDGGDEDWCLVENNVVAC